MKVRFTCSECGQPAGLVLGGTVDWKCPHCDHRLHLDPVDRSLPACPLCGNGELYKKKDFPHGLGLALLTIACLVSVFTYGWYEKWLTWAILIGTALVDGLLYLLVGDAIVCYRCQAEYRGFLSREGHKPYELVIGERYRQERIRHEQLRAPESGPPPGGQ